MKKPLMPWAIEYYLQNFKNVKNTHGGVLLLEKLQASASNFTKSNTPSRVFSRFLNCRNDTKSSRASHMFNKSKFTFPMISKMEFFAKIVIGGKYMMIGCLLQQVLRQSMSCCLFTRSLLSYMTNTGDYKRFHCFYFETSFWKSKNLI